VVKITLQAPAGAQQKSLRPRAFARDKKNTSTEGATQCQLVRAVRRIRAFVAIKNCFRVFRVFRGKIKLQAPAGAQQNLCAFAPLREKKKLQAPFGKAEKMSPKRLYPHKIM